MNHPNIHSFPLTGGALPELESGSRAQRHMLDLERTFTVMRAPETVGTWRPTRRLSRAVHTILAALLVFALTGCGSGGGTTPTLELSNAGNVAPPATGTTSCAQCHSSFPYTNMYQAGNLTDSNPISPTYFDAALAGGSIVTNYAASVHYTPAGSSATDVVTCEGCHGSGSQHYGVGPIPYYMPSTAQCSQCHNGTGPAISSLAVVSQLDFNQTGHANQAATPDQYFFQGGTSATAQASYMNQPEWRDVAGTVAVTKNQHIEECSVCHSPDTKATHVAKGDVPNPPSVGCNSCHDSHRPAAKVRNYLGAGSDTQVDPSQVVNLKPYQVNNDPLGAMFGAINKVTGSWIRPRLHYDYHVGGDAAATYSGYANQGTVGDWLRLSPERLCASCHTKGEYLYGRAYGPAGSPTALPATHQDDVYLQYRRSLHAATHNPPWEEFSLLTASPSHRPQYPFVMGGKAGQNGTTVPFDGRINGGANNFECNQCHHGIGTIDYINGVQGGIALGDSQAAHVLWGDATATCITCHDPHKNGASTSANVRVPKYLSYNAEFKPGTTPTATGNARGGVNTFMDLTPIPAEVGNGIMCLFCHQGRESGWTAWNKVRRNRAGQGDNATVASNFWYTNPNTVISAKGFSFVNDHYLAGGALLFGRNSTEFVGQFYSDGIPQHTTLSCTGCHMAPVNAAQTEGGHTMQPQVSTCQTCHGPTATAFNAIPATGDWNGNNVVQTVYDEIGVATTIPIATGHGVAVYGTSVGGSGLLGLLNEALWDLNIEYDGATYPYFFKGGFAHTSANAYKAWTPNQLAAAQNLQQLIKSGTAPGVGALYVHNPQYVGQILVDSLAALSKTAGTVTTFTRPAMPTGGTAHAGRDYRTLNVP